MFYHPVAWWISRRVREERENCCDDLVEIVDLAAPALRPVSPNLLRGLALTALGVLLDIAGLLMLTGRPNKKSEARRA